MLGAAAVESSQSESSHTCHTPTKVQTATTSAGVHGVKSKRGGVMGSAKAPKKHLRRDGRARSRESAPISQEEAMASNLAVLLLSAAEDRTPIPGGGWGMKIVSAPPSALHSRVEGIFASESLHGRWKLFAHSRRVDPASSSAATATVSETVSPGTGGAAAGGDGVAVANVAATAIASGDDGAELADEVGANGSATANAADMDVSAARVAVDGHVKTGGGGEGGG